MLPPIGDLKTALDARLPGVLISIDGAVLVIQPQDLRRIVEILKAAPYQMDYVANLTAVDYPPDRIYMIYHLYSMAQKHGPVTLRASLPRATPVIDSLVPIYRGAEFQEREVYDLFGVRFEGHPDLRRILMWDEFVGHPMRKDYVPEDQDAPADA